MNTLQIYQQYLIPQNLQKHMLRVASLAKIILEHWIGPQIDKLSIIHACVFHDIAKPINFDLAKQAQFGLTPQDINNLDKLQQRLKNKYGGNEHNASVGICTEIGCSSNTVRIVDNVEWSYIPLLLKKNDFESLIANYADMRIGPKGILTLEKRLEELKIRTGQNEHWQNGTNLEKVISPNVSINLNEITDEQINQNFAYLENLNPSL